MLTSHEANQICSHDIFLRGGNNTTHSVACYFRASLPLSPLSPFRFLFIIDSHHATLDSIIVHTDASRGDQCSGLGYVLSGQIETSGNMVLMGTHTSMEAEYYALIEGLRIASIESDDRSGVVAYTDAKPLVTKMREPDGNSQDWYDRRKSCHWLLNKFDSWELEYVPREHNEDAHQLARTALFEGRDNQNSFIE